MSRQRRAQVIRPDKGTRQLGKKNKVSMAKLCQEVGRGWKRFKRVGQGLEIRERKSHEAED